MFRNFIIIVLGLFLLTGCVDGFRDYFKKSANNKMIDRKGFKGAKRKPLYNGKYIALAKRNVIEENYDESDEIDLDDDLYATPDVSTINRQAYIEMIKEDARRKKRQRFEKRRAIYDDEYEDSYPSLVKASEKAKANGDDRTKDLQKEIAEIKSMLNEAKSDLAKYKCPMQQEMNAGKNVKNSSKSLDSKQKNQEKEKLMTEEDDYEPDNRSAPASAI